MAKRIDLKTEDLSIAVDTAIRNINAGEVIVAPSEFGYIYLCDAFRKDAVKALHILRGDADGVAAQVFIKNNSVLTGLVKSVSNDIEAITDKFWPGPLSITFNAQPGLSWNLGDNGALGLINIRIPNYKFLNELLNNTGPLAAASAALTGKPPILDLALLPIFESDIGVIFSDGVLSSIGKSTVIDATGSQLKIKRSGAIDTKDLIAVIPNLLG